MEFLKPSFLWALLLIAIPIIIHLFYFRRYKKVLFPNVRFLKNIQEEQSTWRNLRNLLVLLARIFAIAFLVFAFAQPFIPTDHQQKRGTKAISIYVDNSFSMNARGSDVNLLGQAKQRALEIIQSQDVGTEFQLISNRMSGPERRWSNREQAIQKLEEIELGPEVRDIPEVLKFQKSFLADHEADVKERYLLSDFQRSLLDGTSEPDTSFSTFFLPIEAVQTGNVAIDSVWLEAPVVTSNQTAQVLVRLKNYSNQAVENVRISLSVGEEVFPFGRLNIDANNSRIDTLTVTPENKGWQEAYVEVSDYPVQFDDRYYFTFFVPEKLSLLGIFQEKPNSYLRAALQGMGKVEYDFHSLRDLNYSAFGQYDLIILDDLKSLSTGLQSSLRQYVEGGGKVLMFPAFDFDEDAYNQFLSKLKIAGLGAMEESAEEVFRIDESSFVFSQVYEERSKRLELPGMSAYARKKGVSQRGEVNLLRLRNGSPFLNQYAVNSGFLLLCYAPLDPQWNDLAKSGEIFIPLLFRSALLSSGDRKLALTIGKEETIRVPKSPGMGEADFRVEGQANFIPLQRNLGPVMQLDFKDQVQEAGFYALMVRDSVHRRIAMNYDRKESRLETIQESELEEWGSGFFNVVDLVPGKNVGETIDLIYADIELWKWCIIFTLVFLAIEQLLLRLWKTE